jgi:hypothetical protein
MTNCFVNLHVSRADAANGVGRYWRTPATGRRRHRYPAARSALRRCRSERLPRFWTTRWGQEDRSGLACQSYLPIEKLRALIDQ